MSKETILEIKNLHATIEGKEILRGVNLTVKAGETHALMGPNGAGKSTLSNVLMGHPAYEVTEGEVWFKGVNLLELAVEERARLGLFLSFQYPVAVPGVSVSRFLKTAVDAVRADDRPSASTFLKELRAKAAYLEVDPSFINRALNEGFSGGEKKRIEILQMLMLQPAFALLDETDSGLDIDALKIVSQGVNKLKEDQPESGLLLITHYERILRYVEPQQIHILVDGKIVHTGGPELVKQLEEHGYDWIREQTAATA